MCRKQVSSTSILYDIRKKKWSIILFLVHELILIGKRSCILWQQKYTLCAFDGLINNIVITTKSPRHLHGQAPFFDQLHNLVTRARSHITIGTMIFTREIDKRYDNHLRSWSILLCIFGFRYNWFILKNPWGFKINNCLSSPKSVYNRFHGRNSFHPNTIE